MNPFKRAYEFYLGIPDSIRKPCQAWIMSATYTAWSSVIILVGFGYTEPTIQCCRDFPTTISFLSGHSWLAILGIVFGVGPFARIFQSRRDVANTITLPSGATATVQKPPPPPPDPPRTLS